MHERFDKLIMSSFLNNLENIEFIKTCISQRNGALIDKYLNHINSVMKKIQSQKLNSRKYFLFGQNYTAEQINNLTKNLDKNHLFSFFSNYYISHNLDNIIYCDSKQIDDLFSSKILNTIIKKKRWDILQKISKNRLQIYFQDSFFPDEQYIQDLSIDECKTFIETVHKRGIRLTYYFLTNQNITMAILKNYQNSYKQYIYDISSTKLANNSDIKLALIALIESGKISVNIVDNNADILAYYLEKKDKNKISCFSKSAFDKNMVLIEEKYYDLMIEMLMENISFLDKLLRSRKILEFYLQKGDKKNIKKFDVAAFSDEIIDKYASIIYELYKGKSSFFVNYLSSKPSILQCCLNQKDYENIFAFDSYAFTEDIIKQNMDIIFKYANKDWVKKTLLFSPNALLYCLKNNMYEYIDAFSLAAFNKSIMEQYIPFIFEKFKHNDSFFLDILSYSPVALSYCIEKGELGYIKKFRQAAFTDDILTKHIDILFNEIKNNESILLNLKNNTLLLEYCFQRKEYELVKKFNISAFSQEIIKTYTKIIFDIFDDDKEKLKQFSKNVDMLKYCLENVDYLKNVKIFDNSTIFNFLIDSDDNLIEIYFARTLGISGEKKEKLLKYIIDIFNNMVQKSGTISYNDIIQYGFNSLKYPNWKNNLYNLITQENELNQFIKVMSFLINNYYYNSCDKKKNINNFFEIMENYEKYKQLLNNLTIKSSLTNEEKGKLKYLFNLQVDIKIDNIDDIVKELETIKTSITDESSCEKIKYVINTLLFGCGSIDDILCRFNTEKLKILKFNNRNHEDVGHLIDEFLIYVSIIEEIHNCNDKNVLKDMIDKCDIKDALEIFNILSKLPELERNLYETENEKNLTKLSEISQQYVTLYNGLKVIDLRDKKYVLYAHTKSHNESIPEICNGTTNNGKHNFICFVPISHRNQKYYGNVYKRIIFAYDHICKDSFICSSDINLSSNKLIQEGSMDLKTSHIKGQKGILETSEAGHNSNAEALFYRDGLKPCGIIIPANRNLSTLTKEEIEIAQTYNLSFILTQNVGETIENPKELLINKNNSMKDNQSELDYLMQMKQKLLGNILAQDRPKQYGIITDIHAMYEPALACLEDMHRRGITEIYSLGDNIGVGPNPKEVLELLKEYNVKSVKGNHEIYVKASQEGHKIKEVLPQHIKAHGQKNQMVADWTGKQIDNLDNYPPYIELTSSSGQKAFLVHSLDEEIIDETLPIFDKNDFVIQGHKHFESISGNIITLRAAGIGDMGSELASYAILSENSNGDFNLDIVEVPYDRSNLLHDVNESSIPDKTDIDNFLRKKR